MNKLTADESCAVLTQAIKDQRPFSFWRFGDGYIECVQKRQGRTCDQEEYTPHLHMDLAKRVGDVVWRIEYEGDPVTYIGDWRSASFTGPHDPSRYEHDYERLIAHEIDRKLNEHRWLHFESLLFMRESRALADFYRAVRADRRSKLYLGPVANEAAAGWLGAEFMPVPMHDLHRHVASFREMLIASDFEVLLWGAGLAGVIPVVDCWNARYERTYIHLGSALDPLFGRPKSRKQQLSKEQCWRMFA